MQHGEDFRKVGRAEFRSALFTLSPWAGGQRREGKGWRSIPEAARVYRRPIKKIHLSFLAFLFPPTCFTCLLPSDLYTEEVSAVDRNENGPRGP